ncbi:unnamed protein product [Mytilus coruscus]|uniref:TRIM71 n=1 Tax=Mytilus coruscus TaxID=42192 RepID=A0A6J8DZT8_MYTCO|nr:unnamed protein product [Mytilus coruscus]
MASNTLIESEFHAKFDREIVTLSPGDKDVTRSHGMIMLEDGRLVVIDQKNRCMKIFKPPHYYFDSRKNFTDEPRGITCCGKEEIAVSFADKQEIRKFKINQDGTVYNLKPFGMQEKPFSISYNRKTFAVEQGEGRYGSIVILENDGKESHVISGASRDFGLFTGNTIRLAHDNNKRVVYVVDIVKGCVNHVSYDGDIKWSMKVISPRGIDYCEQSNILFVASKSDNSVVQMQASDGTIVPFLTHDSNVFQPRFICYQNQAKKLAIEVGGNVVNMYKCAKK